MPTYNEAGNVEPLLREIRRHMVDVAVLVVDDGSTDGTADVVRRLAAHDPRLRLLDRRGRSRGLTASVLDGIFACATQWFVVMDGDLQHPPDVLPALARRLADGADAVVACRRSLGGLRGHRILLSLGANVLAGATLALSRQRLVSDPMSGYFGGRTALFRRLARDRSGFEGGGYKVLFDFLRRLPPDAHVAHVPYTLRPRRNGASKLDAMQLLHVLRQNGPLGRALAALVLPFFTPRFVRFALVGASGIAVNVGLLFGLTEFAGLHYLLSAVVAVEASVLWNFLWNERWTWRDRRGGRVAGRLLRFHQVSVGGLALNLAALYVLTGGLAVPYLASNFVGIALAAAWNYRANHRWTWSPRPTPWKGVDVFRRHRGAAYVAAFLVQAVLAALFMHDWDGFVLEQALRTFLVDGVTPYEVALAAPPSIFLGFHTPPVNTWYAYPPLPLLLLAAGYAPYLLAGFASPALARLAWKLPIVLGNLLLAPLVARYLRLRGVDRRAASRAEAFLLLNPFLVFVGAVWGMFDVWILVFLVASLVAMERGRPGTAGALFALSVLVKPFPLLFLPAFLATVTSRGRAIRFLGGFAATGALVLVPFIPVWEGVVMQTVVLHALRPPQGFAALGLLPVVDGLSRLVPAFLDRGAAQSARDLVSLASFAVLVAVLAAVYVSVRRGASGRRPVPAMALSLFAFLLLSKVVNEQYLVMPLVFLVLLAHEGRPTILSPQRAWRAARWLTYAGTVGALLVGFHFVLFVPPDVALSVWGTDTDSVVAGLAAAVPVPTDLFYALPSLLASALLFPLFLVLAGTVFRAVLGGFRATKGAGMAAGHEGRANARRAAAVGLVVVLLVLPLIGGATRPVGPSSPDGDVGPAEEGGPLVGAFYYTWWRNPSRNPALRYGMWTLTTATPVDGYYDLNARYVELDLLQMRAAGLDFVVVSFNGGDLDRLQAVADLAARVGLRFSVLWELGTLHGDPRNQPTGPRGEPVGPQGGLALRADTLARTTTFLASLPPSLLASPAWLRLDGRPVVFLYDAFVSTPGFSPEERSFLVDAVLSRAGGGEIEDRLGRPVPGREALLELYPRSLRGFLAATPQAAFWRWAYLQAYVAFWRAVGDGVEGRTGEMAWIGGQSWDPFRAFYHGVDVALAGRDVFDGSFVYTPAALWPFRPGHRDASNWEDWQDLLRRMAAAERERGHPVVATVMPAYDDTRLRPKGFRIQAEGGATYERTWDAALSVDPDLVLVTSWNEHFEGTGIEPTEAYGRLFLTITATRTRSAPLGT